ncbi:cation transporter [Sinomonas sp. G460-2]|uniref:cation transporter n=1 Tax=Sinomonas sp. G460-2 TaxID=3393464 RepID=UPI0039EF3F23
MALRTAPLLLDSVRSAAGIRLQYGTFAVAIVGAVLLAFVGLRAGSAAVGGLSVTALVEAFVSLVVVKEFKGAHRARRDPAIRLIGPAFVLLALGVSAAIAMIITSGLHPAPSLQGAVCSGGLAIAAGVLAIAKIRAGQSAVNPVLVAEGIATLVFAGLAAVVTLGLVGYLVSGWWLADPAAAGVVVVYAIRGATASFVR